jgi:hypothetical protein
MGQVLFNYRAYILSLILKERKPNKPPPCGKESYVVLACLANGLKS